MWIAVAGYSSCEIWLIYFLCKDVMWEIFWCIDEHRYIQWNYHNHMTVFVSPLRRYSVTAYDSSSYDHVGLSSCFPLTLLMLIASAQLGSRTRDDALLSAHNIWHESLTISHMKCYAHQSTKTNKRQVLFSSVDHYQHHSVVIVNTVQTTRYNIFLLLLFVSSNDMQNDVMQTFSVGVSINLTRSSVLQKKWKAYMKVIQEGKRQTTEFVWS